MSEITSDPPSTYFIDATNFTTLQRRTATLASTVAVEVNANRVCVGHPAGLLWLFLAVPLGVFLFLQFMRRFCIIAEEDEFRPLPKTTLAATARAAAGVAGVRPRSGKKYRWSLKAADHYLWSMEGGARPLHVNFETATNKALPPSAPKVDDKHMERRSVQQSVRHWEDEDLFDREVMTHMVTDLFCCCCRQARVGGAAGGGGVNDGYTQMSDGPSDNI